MLEDRKPSFPQTGYHLDTEYAEPLGMSVRAFRSAIESKRVPYLRFGNAMVINVDDIRAYMIGDAPPPEE